MIAVRRWSDHVYAAYAQVHPDRPFSGRFVGIAATAGEAEQLAKADDTQPERAEQGEDELGRRRRRRYAVGDALPPRDCAACGHSRLIHRLPGPGRCLRARCLCGHYTPPTTPPGGVAA